MIIYICISVESRKRSKRLNVNNKKRASIGGNEMESYSKLYTKKIVDSIIHGL